MVEQTVQLPGGITGLWADESLMYLVTGSREACLRLAVQTRRLARLSGSLRDLSGTLPGSQSIRWSGPEQDGLRLPLPGVAAPQGEPLGAWLQGPSASASGIIRTMADTARLVDILSAHGYAVEELGLDGVWVQGGRLSWLPAALLWNRCRAVPTQAGMESAGRALGLFLHSILLASRQVSQIDLVWDELWGLCYGLLEHGLGLNSAWLRASLEPLASRVEGTAEPASLSADLLVVVDATSLHRHLKRQSLDLPGVLRSLVGPDRRAVGITYGGTLPPHFRRQSDTLHFTWMTSGEVNGREVEEKARQDRVDEVLLCCGRFEDAEALLPWVNVSKGVLFTADLEDSEPLPQHWRRVSLTNPLYHWCRVGWPGRQDLGGAPACSTPTN